MLDFSMSEEQQIMKDTVARLVWALIQNRYIEAYPQDFSRYSCIFLLNYIKNEWPN